MYDVDGCTECVLDVRYGFSAAENWGEGWARVWLVEDRYVASG